MWLWLLTQTALLQSLPVAEIQITSAFFSSFCPLAQAADSSVGPTSNEEAIILWKDGDAAFKAEDYTKAINLLQRFVDRYPGYEGYLEAQSDLGRAYLLSKQPEKSLKPLEYYILATGNRTRALRARIWLGAANLELGKAHEAYLSALEIEKNASSAPEVFAESQFLKAHALLLLNEDDRAQKVLDSVKEKLVVQTDPELKGQAEQVGLELKIRSCNKMPNIKKPKKMGELQARDTYSLRALCLQEAMIAAKNTVESCVSAGDSFTLSHAQAIVIRGFNQYNEATKAPPPSDKASAQSAEQKKQYRSELIDILEQDRAKAYSDALNTLSLWQKTASGKALEVYQNLSQELGKLSQK
jgi:tetratricopeptide (TPR) repeat protein